MMWASKLEAVGYSMMNSRTSAITSNPVTQPFRDPNIARMYDYLLGGKDNFVVISAGTTSDPQLARRFVTAYTAGDLHGHHCETITSWFDGFEPVEPGLVAAASWRPGHKRRQPPLPMATVLAGIGRKPGEPT